MYLVIVAIDTPGVQLAIENLRHALRASTAGSDSLQHSYLTTTEGTATFSLYVRAANEPTAVHLADQLCRRTMAAVYAGGWSIQSARLGL